MGIDSIKIIYTYSIATIIVLGGMAMLYFSRLDPPGTSENLALVTAGFIGAAIQFVFNRETAANSARQTERATEKANASQPTVTATGGNPPTTTVTPAEPVPPGPG